MTPLSDAALLHELAPVAARNLERHLATSREWLPHEWLPWSRGRDFGGASGVPWTPDQSCFSPAVQAAFTLNLLTEDNLPSYHHELLQRVGSDGAWGAWVRRWTAEEARHAASLRDYVLLSRAIDPVALERDRMATMQAGWTAGGKGLLRSLVYATLQELATRTAHRNTGRAAHDPAAEGLLGRIAADENLHMVFYRDAVAAALAIAPEQALVAIADEVADFEMPGSGTPGYLHHSVLIADAGIYDARTHRDEVVAPLLKHWQVLTLPVAGTAAQKAQQDLSQQLDRLRDIAQRFEQRRAWRERRAHPASDDKLGLS
jgi:acyl-[acyl-carrier-protein] desaturase